MTRFPLLVVTHVVLLALVSSASGAAPARTATADSMFKASTFSGLKFRCIGPAANSGRVSDLAIHPSDPWTWYVAAASGNVWKTSNAGTTWEPIFDQEGSYSVGCLAIDPKHPLTVWVGSGENNSQRSVAYGDGVYKSIDGGKHWKNVGLKGSEHVGQIAIDPRNTDVVYVAAQGPLWTTGGERGLYKTTDGGGSWTRVLHIDDNTGVSEVHLDPRDPDAVYAVAYERHRRVWTLIDGGPGSGLHKSTDAGRTWTKLVNGLPKEEIGRIGLAISPADADVVYAIVEAANKAGGTYRSTDAGANWEKTSDYVSTSPQYYQELIADPKHVDRVYSMDTWMQVTYDGGKTWKRVGEKYKHVDNHALWIDPADTDHMIAGCDGGLYTTFDRGATWVFHANLPITQFYKVAVDESLPFYYVYGGTQDNFTVGGPSRTATTHGILNSDWFVTVGGDGFQTQVDPQDPNIVYSQSQHAELARFDRKSGERTGIQPQPEPGDDPSRWNWDSPLVLSPHLHTRLYFAAQRVYRSDDRGDSWRAVSPDLTRRIDRNRLRVAGRAWSVDAVAKNASTSFYGNIVALAESPVREGLLYVGTDDGVVQVSEDGGGHWRRGDTFSGVPALTYVSRLLPSQHDEKVVYAAFDNHKTGDFQPYVLRSDDRGRTWHGIAGNLPARGTVYALAEDHVDPDLLFAGTEFGVWFTVDGGRRWTRLDGGIPTIQARDLAIQKRENDLVVATFGRGFYVLDDYTSLRRLKASTLAGDALFPVRKAPMFIPSTPLGTREKGMLGDALYSAENPPFGAIFTYYLRDEVKTRRKQRLAREKELAKRGADVFYPSWDSLAAEDREEDPAIVLTVSGDDGAVVRRIAGPVTAGFSRVAWDLRYPGPQPVSLKKPDEVSPFADPPVGPLAAPGTYYVSLAKRVDGRVTPIGERMRFEAAPLDNATLPAKDRGAVLAMQQKTARLQRAVLGAVQAAREAENRLAHVRKALDETPAARPELRDRTRDLMDRLQGILVELTGDRVRGSRHEPVLPSITDRLERIVDSHWRSTAETPQTCKRDYEIAAGQFTGALAMLRTLIATDLVGLEAEAEAAGAPWTPGRLPDWKPE